MGVMEKKKKSKNGMPPTTSILFFEIPCKYPLQQNVGVFDTEGHSS
jgi:hypothetical protein